ncbi:MAG: hypothetical protein H6636_01160 [Anaerolineales bacterium]|nr:hypothetical protein [Anaerolineales bacterium]
MFIPCSTRLFAYFRARFGEPRPCRITGVVSSQLAGLGFGQALIPMNLNGMG